MDLPKDIEVERIVLGTMLSSVDAVNTAMDVLEASDFYEIEHKDIFASMARLYKKDFSIDPDTVYHEMEKKEMKLLAYMYELLAYKITSEIDSLVFKLQEKSKYRKHILFLQNSIKEAKDSKQSSEKYYQNFCRSHDEIFTGLKESTLRTPKEVLEKYEDGLHFLDYVEKQQQLFAEGKSTLRGISTGYKPLDSRLSGLCKGHMVIIAARPGVGKSTFALNMIIRMVKNGTPVLFFSMEMTSAEVTAKLVSIEAGVSYQKFNEGSIDGNEYQLLVEAAKKIENYPLYIEEQGGLTPSQIKSRARRNIENNGIQAVFIDYLTCISPDVKRNSREEGVRDISMSLRDMAKGFKIPFVCICQENRDSEKSQGEETARAPKKTDLGQSGSLEQDAHSIIMLRRPSIFDPMDKPGIIQAWVVKNRFGPEGKVEFNFDGAKSQVNEIDWSK